MDSTRRLNSDDFSRHQLQLGYDKRRHRKGNDFAGFVQAPVYNSSLGSMHER